MIKNVIRLAGAPIAAVLSAVVAVTFMNNVIISENHSRNFLPIVGIVKSVNLVVSVIRAVLFDCGQPVKNTKCLLLIWNNNNNNNGDDNGDDDNNNDNDDDDGDDDDDDDDDDGDDDDDDEDDDGDDDNDDDDDDDDYGDRKKGK